MKKFNFILFIFLMLSGCARGQLDILDQSGNTIGNCSADFKFHWYGAQDSVNYILYLCAKEQMKKGFSVSDESIFLHDYQLPDAPAGKVWSKKLAKAQFSANTITEQQLGYLLADVEYQYWMKLAQAQNELSNDMITQDEYNKKIAQAKKVFEGQ